MGLIRLLLALSVAIAHSDPLFTQNDIFVINNLFVSGLVAVESFFVISGFYMALVMHSKYSGNIMSFYRNRFLRIFPAYWTTLLIAIVFAVPSRGNVFAQLIDLDFSVSTKILIFTSNIMIFGSDVMSFLSTGTGGLYLTERYSDPAQLRNYLFIPQAWTLPLELIFYMIVPFVYRRKSIVIAMLTLSLVIKIMLLKLFGWVEPWNNRFFPAELMMFCLGVLAHEIYVIIKSRNIPKHYGTIALIFIALITISFKMVPVALSVKTIMYYLLLVLLIPVIFIRFGKNKLDRLIGELSYPVYLCHMIVISMSNYLAVNIIGSIIMAFMINRYVSEPIEQRFKVM